MNGHPDSTLRLSGILRTLPYRNLIQAENHTVMGWGAMLSSVARPTNSLSTYATGELRARIFWPGNRLDDGNYDLVGDNQNRERTICAGIIRILRRAAISHSPQSVHQRKPNHYPPTNKKHTLIQPGWSARARTSTVSRNGRAGPH